MRTEDILSRVDHTLLSPEASRAQIEELCADAVRFSCASVCVAPSYVALAKELTAGKIKVCTVIGFPCGYETTAVKIFETQDAINNGADEIDMVVNIGLLKDGQYDRVLSEIRAVKDACHGKTLKVIIETCLLTDDEKIKMCGLVTEAGADFIKTSTGFSKDGATFRDAALLKKHIGEKVKVKAAGGIKTLEDAEEFIRLGCDRLGTSRIVALMKNRCDPSSY